MRKLTIAAATGLAALSLTLAAGTVHAGPDRIAFPEGFEKTYKLYGVIDRPDSKVVRYFYVDPASLKAATYGKPLPDGTTLVMAFKKAKLGPDGEPVLDKNGHMIPDGDFTRVAVQKKGKGWGADHSEKQQNGDWEYAEFKPDGSRNADVKSYDSCFSCHNNRQKPAEDFTFLFAPYLRDHKKG
jgi:hypothetical protein